ncbi:MAG: LysR family transcriptional regulator [Thermaerobacter sp.]|nr:LysR family transcriptional regulator [Thermaerobacter sp.]
MNPQSWETFRAVAEARSISAAARTLNLSPSAVSQQIQQMEESYHCRLLVRHTHGVNLTTEGEVLYRYAKRLLRTLAESHERLAELSDPAASRLRIGASLTIAEYVLPDVLAQLYRPEPRDHVSVMMANSEAVCDFVLNQAVDVGLVEAEVEKGPLVAERFYTDRAAVYVGAGHRWATQQAIDLEEFMQEPLILREPGSGTRRALERALDDHERGIEDLSVRLVLATTEAIKAMVRAGFGATVLSPLAIRPDETSGFHAMAVRGLDLTRHFYAVHLPVTLPAGARRLIHLLTRPTAKVGEQ